MSDITESQHIQLRDRFTDIKAKWRLFDALGYKVYHPEVKRFHNSTARVKICRAPARTTKSYSAAHDVLPDILCPNTIGWIVGPNYTLAEKEFRVIKENLVDRRDRLGLPKPRRCLENARSGSLSIKFDWGSVVEGKSAENPGSLLGEKVDWIIYSEAAEVPRLVRERYCGLRLITRKGRELVPTTPQQGAEWVHELDMLGQEGKYDYIESFNWDYRANPEYRKEEFERAKQFYGEDHPVFREQYLGEWTFYGGNVYPQFRPDLHVIDPFDIPANWPRIRAMDFGHKDPFVCLWAAVGPEQEIYVYREYYTREGKSIREHASNIKSMSRNHMFIRTVGDPSAKQAIEDLCYEGVGVEPANNDRQAGRMRVVEYLTPTHGGPPPYPYKGTGRAKLRDKWPRIYFFRGLKETLREFKFYRWKESTKIIEGQKEKTEGEDHAMDTLRYLCMTRPSPYESERSLRPYSWDWWASYSDTADMRTESHVGQFSG